MKIETFNNIIRNLTTLIMTVAFVIQIFNYGEVTKNPPPEIKPVTTISIEIPKLTNGLVNINTANLHQLWNINGLGETKARAILKYREEHGNFTSVDDLVNVKGISEKTLEQIRESITIAPSRCG